MCGGVIKQKTHNRLLVMGSSCDQMRDAFIGNDEPLQPDKRTYNNTYTRRLLCVYWSSYSSCTLLESCSGWSFV